jgi:hypothetical protein
VQTVMVIRKGETKHPRRYIYRAFEKADMTFENADKVRKNSSRIWVSKEVEAKGERRREKRKKGEGSTPAMAFVA